jgi:hypothetical protein
LLASGPDGQSGIHQFQYATEAGKDGSVIDPTEGVTPTVGWLIVIAALLLLIFFLATNYRPARAEVAHMMTAAEKDKEMN